MTLSSPRTSGRKAKAENKTPPPVDFFPFRVVPFEYSAPSDLRHVLVEGIMNQPDRLGDDDALIGLLEQAREPPRLGPLDVQQSGGFLGA